MNRGTVKTDCLNQTGNEGKEKGKRGRREGKGVRRRGMNTNEVGIKDRHSEGMEGEGNK